RAAAVARRDALRQPLHLLPHPPPRAPGAAAPAGSPADAHRILRLPGHLKEPAMRELTVLYDSGCALCVRCCDWLGEQRQLVPIRMLACTSEEARSRYGAIPWLGEELVVVSDQEIGRASCRERV